MPLNCLDATFRSFEKQVLPEVNKRGIAALGMKPMGGTAAAVKSGLVKAEEMLRYAMSLPVADHHRRHGLARRAPPEPARRPRLHSR